MKSKGILIAKAIFIAVLIASFFVLEDPITRKCRKAELEMANLKVNPADTLKAIEYSPI